MSSVCDQAFIKNVLHANFGRLKAQHPEHAHSVGEGGAAALYAVVDIRRSKLVRVDVDRGRHPSHDGLFVEYGHLEAVWMSA